jgi:hypothetical protein
MCTRPNWLADDIWIINELEFYNLSIANASLPCVCVCLGSSNWPFPSAIGLCWWWESYGVNVRLKTTRDSGLGTTIRGKLKANNNVQLREADQGVPYRRARETLPCKAEMLASLPVPSPSTYRKKWVENGWRPTFQKKRLSLPLPLVDCF